MDNFKNKTVFITGGASGIGKEFAKILAAKGAIICIADINIDAVQDLVNQYKNTISAVNVDVRNASDLKNCIETFAQKNGSLDYIFNSAGVAIAGECDEIPLKAWEYIIDVNIYGVLNGVLAAYPIMLKQGYGHIINIASLAGLGPAPLVAPYSLTKHAVVGLSTSLRIEAAERGVKVSVLCPSAIETPILDKQNPPEFNIKWMPNMRRFLTALAGAPYPVEKCAQDAIAAIEKNKGIIVLPKSAKIAWRLGRISPNLVEKLCGKAVKAERESKS